MTSWISLYPKWFADECNSIARSYPHFRRDERLLHEGLLCFFGDIMVRTPAGTTRFPVRLVFLEATPYAAPIVTPIEKLPDFDTEGGIVGDMPPPKFFNRRHQMSAGGLCLFHTDARTVTGGEIIRAREVLRRAELWFVGQITGRWPPDFFENGIQSHFRYCCDILLSKTFFSQELGERGSFVAVRDLNRNLLGGSKVIPPLIMTMVTTVSHGVESVLDAREDIQNIYPWLTNDAWQPARVVESETKRASDPHWQLITERGHWWSLPAEPEPFHDGAGLLKALQSVAPDGDSWRMLSNTLGSDLATSDKHLVGLRYVAQNGQVVWLVLEFTTENPADQSGIPMIVPDSQKRDRFERAAVACYHVHGARIDDIQLRNSTVVDTAVRTKAVALIGLGALGSKVAELLAQAGVGAFKLCDYDVLTVGNVARHVGGLRQFGERKTRVVAMRLWDINPYLRIPILLNDDAANSLDRLKEFITDVDLVVSTTADEGTESAINQAAVLANKTVVYGRAMRRGSVGRVFFVRPRVDACKACLAAHSLDSQSADWINVDERDEDVLLHECGRPVIPASAIDLSMIASLVARTALDLLEGQETTTNHLVWSRDRAPDIHADLSEPLSTALRHLSPRGDCPICREWGITRVALAPNVESAITSETSANGDTETGGILIGYVEGDTAHVLRATGPGPNAVKTGMRFERDVEYTQAQLDSAASELGDKGSYLGEWHSHLVSDPSPSGQDILSLTGIASSPNYSTNCPVMMIAGLDKSSNQVSALKAWSFPVESRVFEIPVVIMLGGPT